jgi:hypothetical protein
MSIKDQKELITDIFASFFSNKDSIEFYFLKKSRVSAEHENIIPFKTRNRVTQFKLSEIEQELKLKLKNEELKLVRWSEIIGKIMPLSRVHKIPFFDTKNIEVKNPWRACPIGQHWVSRHPKNLKSGKTTDHDGHCRKNPSKKDLLKGDEINKISQHPLFRNPPVTVSSYEFDFGIAGSKYDRLISGWTAYWNDVFKISPPLHPNHVKALIATESSFIAENRATNTGKDIGLARGLIQITEQTHRGLKGYKNELKDHIVDLDLDELWDPNKNIAAGIRWLFRKRETARARIKKNPTWEEVLMEYKRRLTSKTKKSQDIKLKLRKYIKILNEN